MALITLTEEDFRTLVTGKVVRKKDVSITLETISFNRMIEVTHEQYIEYLKEKERKRLKRGL